MARFKVGYPRDLFYDRVIEYLHSPPLYRESVSQLHDSRSDILAIFSTTERLNIFTAPRSTGRRPVKASLSQLLNLS